MVRMAVSMSSRKVVEDVIRMVAIAVMDVKLLNLAATEYAGPRSLRMKFKEDLTM
jgi:hypothetical protein